MDDKLEELKKLYQSIENRETKVEVKIYCDDGRYKVYCVIKKLKEYYEYDKLSWFDKILLDKNVWNYDNILYEKKLFESLESFEKPLEESIKYFTKYKENNIVSRNTSSPLD